MASDYSPFSIARLPEIHFGAGMIKKIPGLIATCGTRGLLVTGAHSFENSSRSKWLDSAVQVNGVSLERVRITDEPSPALIDDVVNQFHNSNMDFVIAIGGGSALDAGKAIAGLLPMSDSVTDYLEGVGKGKTYRGPALPFFAVPTTAGTGSEATKNAVLSVRGEGGFKKSFRDDKLIARAVVVDPDLLATCPPSVIAANGMDAFTQLLEAYVSSRANPLTDSLVREGLGAVRDGLLPLYRSRGADPHARECMAYAALISGIALAQTGLGSVHGLAAPLGALFSVPHGVACGTLVAEATDINISAMLERNRDNVALVKYGRVAALLLPEHLHDEPAARGNLVKLLRNWTRELNVPTLSKFNVCRQDTPRLVENARGSSMKTNPVVLTDAEIAELVHRRL